MRTPSAGFKVAGLLLLLPVGCVILLLLSGMLKHRYDDSGFGSFYGLVKANLLYFGPDRSFAATIEGTSPVRWHWVQPDNYQYTLLDFSWLGKMGDGTGQIDTASMTLKLADHSVAISHSSLSELFFGMSPNTLEQGDVEAIDYVHGLIVQAGRGLLAGPRHHTYHFDKPVGVSMAHFSVGSRFPYSLYWWAGLWGILCLGIVLRRK